MVGFKPCHMVAWYGKGNGNSKVEWETRERVYVE